MTLTSLALCCAFLSPLQADTDTRIIAVGLSEAQVKEVLATRMESDLGLTLYQPASLSTKYLVRYAKELTDRTVTFYRVGVNGQLVAQSRDRFVVMDNVIGIQDFRTGQEEAMKLLKRLESELSASSKTSPSPGPETHRGTIDLVRMSPIVATDLVRGSWSDVQVGSSSGSSIITIRGINKENVDAAMALLNRANQPLPQVLLHWTLLEPVAPGSAGADELASPAVSAALQPFAPGKIIKRSGSFMVRGAAGDDSELRVSTTMTSLKGASVSHPCKVSLAVKAKHFDAETGTLQLDDCEVAIARRLPQVSVAGESFETIIDQLATNLTVQAGETTVVGSLGGDPVFVALTFTIIP